MKRKNENLILALAKFSEDWWLPFEDSIGLINTAIHGGMINKGDLENEFLESVSNENFNWNDLAKESQLLIAPDLYSNVEISNYVKFLLSDYLFPQKILSLDEIQSLNKEVKNILKNYSSDNGWMFSYDLYEELKRNEQFKNLEYYHLWKVPFYNIGIERKPVNNKDKEIGYLKFK